MSVYPLTTPLDFRLARELFKFGPLKWGRHHWTVGVVSPTRRRRAIRQHKSSVPHLHPQERGFCVAIDDVLSAPRLIRTGVPQGSCLSPELYALYTDDIPTLRGHLEDWEDDVILALYADDSAYFASSRRADLAVKRIQRVFDLLPKWLDKWKMAVNVSKMVALLTGSQGIMSDQLRLRGQAVEWKTCVRYLGVHIHRSLCIVPQ
ncbi:RNA-directed DNA polymerase from mobile element jockey [Eumeta japonica]|uniref:RNA-directed DNA polymerase from mobile element jockey n=1 Tax=Eumeta variegata TaxID=151549 RepID=A0A4C1U6P5_EUMVA|nr:RNA-directed DNA polymerase from mobile element jockey [Eumeta japonica]